MIRIIFDVDIIFSLKAQGSKSAYIPLPTSIVLALSRATFQRHFNVLIRLLKYFFSAKQFNLTNVSSRRLDVHVLCQFKAATLSFKNAVNQLLAPQFVAD
jgi:hypothetical protein